MTPGAVSTIPAAQTAAPGQVPATRTPAIATALATARPATATVTATATAMAARPEWASLVAVVDGNLILVSGDGKRQQRLTGDGGCSTPRASPEGTRVAFVQGEGVNAEIGLVSVDGTGRQLLTKNTAADLGPVWSPDGKTIAFTRIPDTTGDGRVDARDEAEVWLMDADGGNQRRLANGRDPAWAPEGLRLAFATNGRLFETAPYRRDNAINVINARGGNEWTLVRVADVPAEVQLGGSRFGTSTIALKYPAWRSDGGTIAFTTSGHTAMVLTISAKATDLRMLDASYEGGYGRVVWSPAGDRLAYESFPPIGIAEIVVFDPVGQRLGTLGGKRQNISAAEPAWSPDGRLLAFAQQEAEPYLGLANRDGTEVRPLFSGRLRWPDWLAKR